MTYRDKQNCGRAPAVSLTVSEILLWGAIIALMPAITFAVDRHYEFRVTLWEEDKKFEGQAQIKLAVYDDTVLVWTNDGSARISEKPERAFQVTVTDGVCEIVLGEPPMQPFQVPKISISDTLRLYAWVDIGHGFEALNNPYRIILPGDNPAYADFSDNLAPSLHKSSEVIDQKIERKKNRRKEMPRSPSDRQRYRYLMRADSAGNIEPGVLMRAKEQFDALREAQPSGRDAGLWNWEWLGPGNIGGRIRAILIHPTITNRMWIGGVAGGIWRTDNAGGSWFPVDDFMANLAITSIVMDPTNSNIMYASTGEGFGNTDALPGAGVFKSTDGGITWNQLPTTALWQFANRLVHHPSQTNILYAATIGGVRTTTNGGDTWTNILNFVNTNFLDIDIHPANAQIIFVGTDQGVFSTTDGGASWVSENTGTAGGKMPANVGRCEVAINRLDPDYIYVSLDTNSSGDPFGRQDAGQIWRTTDGGANWILMYDGEYLGIQGWYDNVIWIDPLDTDHIVVGGIDLWRSTDGGVSLAKISAWQNYHEGLSAHADQHVIVEHPNYDGVGMNQVFFGNDGGIQRTDDIMTVSNNSGWTNLANNLGITQFYGGAAAPDGSVIIGGSQDNDKLRYQPGSGTGSWYQATTGDGGYAAINYNDLSILYGEYVFLRILKSTDGGNGYSNAISGLSDANDSRNSLFIAPFVMDPTIPENLVAGGSSIWRTTNSADSWSKIRDIINPKSKCSAIDIAKTNSDVIWVGYMDGTVSKSTDAGVTWTDVHDNTPNLPCCRTVTDIAIDPTNENNVFVTLGSYQFNNVWYTTDAGLNWEVRTGTAPFTVPAVQVNTVRFHPLNSNWIYLGTDLGLLASEDEGLNWSTTPRYSNNEIPVNTEIAELFWQGNEYLIAATHGRGMFRAHPLAVIYVNLAWTGFEDGSEATPYNTVQEAIDNAGYRVLISIKSGTYSEATIIFHRQGTVRATNGSVIIR